MDSRAKRETSGDVESVAAGVVSLQSEPVDDSDIAEMQVANPTVSTVPNYPTVSLSDLIDQRITTWANTKTWKFV